ncbi:hypothetical protein ACOMHN_056502 [Nucella lapillus]
MHQKKTVSDSVAPVPLSHGDLSFGFASNSIPGVSWCQGFRICGFIGSCRWRDVVRVTTPGWAFQSGSATEQLLSLRFRQGKPQCGCVGGGRDEWRGSIRRWHVTEDEVAKQ